MPNGVIELRLDGPRITNKQFVAAVESFFELLDSVSSELTSDSKPIRWGVEVATGSAIVRATVLPEEEQSVAQDALEIVLSGVVLLQTETQTVPRGYTRGALKAAKRLAEVVDQSEEQPPALFLKNGGAPLEVTYATAFAAEQLLGEKYKALSEVTGKLDMLSDRRVPEFSVSDEFSGASVRCFVQGEKLIGKAVDAFRKRVRVRGMVRYSKEDKPTSVVASDIVIIPSDDELPELADAQAAYN